ncbi:GGDEF domain-containing protein [Streptomyces olivochromogenes]|uniref:GGDEF domain-containing protein n=1 Tax=Streptomyces olivochromogenes TaxID=1963 RepID=UPI001F3316D1|nr:GGDEF domain-containing protein [Streptomyces olivochromogenes]MCF3129848.1 GGDEF domain-containing protein [Streptomyces olivochromogenes]
MSALTLAAAAGAPVVAWGVHAAWMVRRLHTARRDPLTGLWTRDAFTRRARRLLRNRRTVVVLADVDRFKQVNDTHGHAAGDALLAATAARLTHGVGPGAVVGRLGGDEFAAVFVDRDGTVQERLDTLARVLARPLDTAPQVRTTVSLGWVCQGDHLSDDLSGLLRRADEAMYAAKAGPSRVRRARLGWLLTGITGMRPGRRRSVA